MIGQRFLRNLDVNAERARHANERFIDFEEDAISELKTAGSLATGVAYLFGGPGAVVALCIMALTEVAAQNLAGKQQKIAAAVSNIEGKLASAKQEIDDRHSDLISRIDGVASLDFREWAPIANIIANSGVPTIVSENIIYRDLLLALASGGGYNISGSQWNVDNMAIFGDAPWYHSWDWGSPGWTNGKDIADELNTLAEADRSTRKKVSINPP